MNHKTLEEFDIKTWCEEFEKIAKDARNYEEFDNEDTEIFMFCALNEVSLENDEKFKSEAREVAPIIRVIEKRLVLYNYKMTFASIFALGMLFDNNLGTNTMNMTYLEYLSKKYDRRDVNMNLLGMVALPHGKLKDSIYHRLWDEQKVKMSPNNALDYPEVIQRLSNI